MRHTTSCSATVRSMPSRTTFGAVALGAAARPRSLAAGGRSVTPPPGCAGARSRVVYQSTTRSEREREGQEQHGGGDVGRVVERARRDDLRLAHRFPDPEHADQGDVLLQADDRVHQRGDHVADGLREDGVAQRLPLGEADGPGRRALALGHRVDAATGRSRRCTREYERVSAVMPQNIALDGRPPSCERGHAEAEQQDQQDQRDAPEQVDEHDRQRRGAGRTPGPGSCAPPPRTRARTGMATHGPDEHLDVGQKPCSTSGHASRKLSRLKNWWRTCGQFGLLTTSRDRRRADDDRAGGGDERAARPLLPGAATRTAPGPGAAASRRSAADPVSVTAAITPSGSGCRRPGCSHSSWRAASVPSSFSVASASLTHGMSGLPVSKSSPSSSASPCCGQHADDRRSRGSRPR